MTRNILPKLIILTAAIFSLTFAAFQEYLIAALALAAGLIWLRLRSDPTQILATLFFLFFLILAIVGCLLNLPVLIMLFGVCIDLVVWDLYRFQIRATRSGRQEIEPAIETKHLQRLSVIIGIGLVIALVPTAIRLPTVFVLFAVLTLMAMFVLRALALYLRQEDEHTQNRTKGRP